MAASPQGPPKAEYIGGEQTVILGFSLATLRRTIYADIAPQRALFVACNNIGKTSRLDRHSDCDRIIRIEPNHVLAAQARN